MPSRKPKPAPEEGQSGQAGLWLRLLKTLNVVVANVAKNPVGIAALVVALIGSSIAWRNYSKSPEMTLEYHRVVPLINPQIKTPNKLEILSDGKPIKSPFIILATLKNDGDLAVEGKNVTDPPSIVFPDYIKVLGASAIDKGGSGVKIRTDIKGNKLSFIIGDMLNKKEYADLEILVDGSISLVPRLKARIPNVQPQTTYNPCGVEFFHVTYFALHYVFEILILVISSIVPIYVAWASLLRWKSLRNKTDEKQFASFFWAVSFTLMTVSSSLITAGAWRTLTWELQDGTAPIPQIFVEPIGGGLSYLEAIPAPPMPVVPAPPINSKPKEEQPPQGVIQ